MPTVKPVKKFSEMPMPERPMQKSDDLEDKDVMSEPVTAEQLEAAHTKAIDTGMADSPISKWIAKNVVNPSAADFEELARKYNEDHGLLGPTMPQKVR